MVCAHQGKVGNPWCVHTREKGREAFLAIPTGREGIRVEQAHVEGKDPFLFILPFSHTHTHTHTHARGRAHAHTV